MAEAQQSIQLGIEGFSQFKISPVSNICHFTIASAGDCLATEFSLQNYTLWGLIDEIEQALVGPRQRISLRNLSMLQLSE